MKSKYDKQYFEKIIYRETPNSQRNAKRMKLILQKVKSGSLLEIGFAKAELLRLADQYFTVEGIDISSYAVRAGKTLLGNKVHTGNIEHYPLISGIYNVVVAFNVLEHLDNPAATCLNIYRGLKRGGVFIGSVPNNYGLVGSCFTKATNFIDHTHVSTYEPRRWQRIFRQVGFTNISMFGEIPFGRNTSIYTQQAYWPYISFNLMFVCIK